MKPLEHINSYYAASVNSKTNYPPLEGSKKADVCVIGAGFTGVAASLSLAERGYDVSLIEANRVGWGASGRNGGQIIGGFSGEEEMFKKYGEEFESVIWNMRWEGNDIIKKRVKKYSINCDLKWGYLDVALKNRHIKDFYQEKELMEKYNFPHQTKILTHQETKDLIGTNAYIGSFLNQGNGHVHSLNLCIGEAKAAESLGTKIYEQSPVLEIKKNKRATVVTENGSITADIILIAGNAYHQLDPKLRNYIIPVNSFIIATEPLPENIIEEINPKDLAVCDPNYVLEYFRLTADKRLLFGSRIKYFSDDKEYIEKQLRKKLSKIYPKLADIRVDFAWRGTIGVTINRVPQLGKLAPNIFYSQGYSGHGVNMTHLAGKIIAETITGTMERFDLFNNIKPIAIPGTYTLRKPLVSLGIMFYKLIDKM